MRRLVEFLRQVGTSDSDCEFFHSKASAIAIAQTHYLYVTIFVFTQNASTVIPTDFSASASLVKFALGLDNNLPYFKRFSTRFPQNSVLVKPSPTTFNMIYLSINYTFIINNYLLII